MSHEAKAEPEKAAGSSSLVPKILISGFVATVVVVESVLFFYFVPSADDIAALAEAQLIKKVEATMEKEGESTVDDDTKAIEYSLGDYSVPFIPSGSDRNYRVEMRLFGTVQKKSMPKLDELYKERFMRLRHRLNLEIRNATLEELNENDLGLIQRRILATSNELFGEPILLGVGFKDYQVVEE